MSSCNHYWHVEQSLSYVDHFKAMNLLMAAVL